MSDCKIKKGSNFTAYESGALKEWPEHTVEFPGLGEIPGKLFLKDVLGFLITYETQNAPASLSKRPGIGGVLAAT